MTAKGSVFETPIGWRGKVPYKAANGRTRFKWFRGKSRKNVRDQIRRFLDTRQLEVPEPDMDVAQLCAMAIAHAESRDCAEKTVRGYRNYTKTHIGPALGRTKVADLQPWHVEELMDGMGTSRQTKLLVRAFLRTALNRVAVKFGIVTRNAAALADPPARERGATDSRAPLTTESLNAILDAETNPVLQCLYLTIASTGLRITEATRLTWHEIHERDDGRWIMLTHSKTDAGLAAIPVPDATWREIEALGKRSVCVFPTSVGTPFNESNLRRAWARTLKRAGVRYTNLYRLRKLYGSLKARKVSDVILKRLMRHTDVRTTKQFYVEPFDEDLRDAVED
ncbi:MAG: tyrosine-type recombinase/integrase [Armatimonadetes bacterium]|nr:tyrosine-type recombinase/integrase [Armatimonadota bacterium]